MKTITKVLGILSTVFLFVLFSFKPTEEKRVIVIDAGHGGEDLGAVINGIQEKTISETIAKKVKALNKDSNIEVVLLRDGDHFIELKDRVSMINNLNPDLVISLHINSSQNKDMNGVRAYVSSSKKEYRDKSMESAEKIVNSVSGNNLAKGKIEEANFYILKNANCPAVTLEVGYLSNNNDRAYLNSEKGQNEIASRILESVK